MRYIRFLKVPRVKDGSIEALITITTDLGESYYPEEAQLAATIQSVVHDGDIQLRKNVTWRSDSRSLPLLFKIKSSDLNWPVRLHVSLRNAPKSDHFKNSDLGLDLPHIISAWSDVLDPSLDITEATRTVERRFIPLNGRTISMWEETGESIARHLWDAGIALTAYLDRVVSLQAGDFPLVERLIGSATNRRLHVIELGSGCGIVGISLAQSIPDCEVILTDLPEAETVIRRNIEGMDPASSSCVIFRPWNWNETVPSAVQHKIVDLVLVADCTYNPDSSSALINTMLSIVTQSPNAVFVVAMKIRHTGELVFFELMQKAEFVPAGEVRIPLPKISGEQEHVDAYCYHHKGRSS